MCVLLRDLQARAPVHFDLLAVHLDQGQPGYDGTPLASWLAAEGIPHKLLHEDTYAIVTDKIPAGNTYCSLCSRCGAESSTRAAAELGCNKIALGHHRDDALETLLLNLFFGGKLAAMPPQPGDRRRPLRGDPPAGVRRRERPGGVRGAAQFPDPPCLLCGSQENAQRKQMKALLTELEKQAPDAAPDDARRARQREPVAPLRPQRCRWRTLSESIVPVRLVRKSEPRLRRLALSRPSPAAAPQAACPLPGPLPKTGEGGRSLVASPPLSPRSQLL